jgi:cyclic beta-1,2-glucan glucanotransferase
MNDTIVDTRRQHSGDVNERLRSVAHQSRSWDVVMRPSGPGTFSAHVRAAQAALKQFEKDTAQLLKESEGSEPQDSVLWRTLREIQSTPRLLRSAIHAVADRPRAIARLPRLVHPGKSEEPRAAAVAAAYLQAVNGEFSADTFRGFIHACQEHEPFNVDELWNLAAFLRLALLELIVDEARALMHAQAADSGSVLAVWMKSLRAITNADLVFLIEPLITFDALLMQDPAAAYARMDLESRELYRKRIAYLARYSDYTEQEVAQATLNLAQQDGAQPAHDPRIRLRRVHVGYYLIDDGLPQLAERVNFHPPLLYRLRRFVRANGEDLFITGIQLFTLLTLAAAIFPILPQIGSFLKFAVAVLLLLLPASQGAVDLMNQMVTALFEPTPLPKLDFSDAIPAECSTLVAIPSLLLNEKQVHGLVNDLEVRYLANRDANLHFALLTDLADSVSTPRERDSHPLVELGARLIEELNAKYRSADGGSFILLHRHRIFNARQGVWMGWERKRGKLLDLNKLLVGEYDAFPIKAGGTDALKQIRYIITLDSDTELPRDTAARMIGAIAHPLNQAVIDPRLRIVTAGYGILQPRVGITVPSAARSRLATIFSGQSGFDIYTRAISDPYQDLFDEGIFTGKGIYEVAALHAVLNRRFPRNALLSHDLIEGAYARAGLATDIEIIDDYPSHYSAYSRRMHRWVRGDWQIVQWMFSRVPDEAGKWGPNPISAISRWKILDNLRRSLVDPFLFILFIAGWFWLPAGPLYWTVVPLILLAIPAVVQFCFGVGRAIFSGYKGQTVEALSGLGHTALLILLRLVFLAHQTLLAIDAIVRSLVRRFITGERLLEWETAAQAEQQSRNRAPADRYLVMTPLMAVILAVLIWLWAPHKQALFCAAPILVLWALAGLITAWLNRPPSKREPLNAGAEKFLLGHALRIWRYFHQFGVERHHYLIPDNVEERGLCEAARVSPTNIGLLLNARQAACELGFITVAEFASLTGKSLATIAGLEKYRGHLYNWYNTETLEPLDASPFVSSVDSGNFVASLYTLHTGAKDLLRRPLLSMQLFAGLRAHWRLIQSGKRPSASVAHLHVPAQSASLSTWLQWLPQAEDALNEAAAAQTEEHSWWLGETHCRIKAIRGLIDDCLPWVLTEFETLGSLLEPELEQAACTLSIGGAMECAETLLARLSEKWDSLAADASVAESGNRLRVLLIAAIANLNTLAAQLDRIANDAGRLSDETEFDFLIDPGRRILSIGFDVRREKLHEACYDLIASEARIATFLAIARGDLSQQSWFKLGRDHAFAYGQFLLYSWTGTMFEYLMPALWMRSYPGTLIARTQDAVVQVQRAFARPLGIPWGISESGAARADEAGDYQYKAFGVPSVALWFEATAGPVISPYSTFLTLSVDPHEALRNLHRMESARWVGPFGFYEAADYMRSQRPPELVREWMAHHQGMSLLAITNVLCDSVVQRWFHENPQVQATELLLHEIPQSKSVLKAKLEECAPIRAV